MMPRANSLSTTLLARPNSIRGICGGGAGGNLPSANPGSSTRGDGEETESLASGGRAEGVAAAAGTESGERGGALFYHRSAATGAAAMRSRIGRHGKPLLLPRPTLAAHNGRMLMEYEWANAGFF